MSAVLPRFAQKFNESAWSFRSAQERPGSFGIDESWSRQVDLHRSLRSDLIGISVDTGTIRVSLALRDGRSVGNRIQLNEGRPLLLFVRIKTSIFD
jgi:hypothetical protein